MKAKSGQVVGQRPSAKEIMSTTLVKNSDVEALHRQRIRFDGFFTGPTW
jgi:hypothetical protein